MIIRVNNLITTLEVKTVGGTVVNSVGYGYTAGKLTAVTAADGSTTTYVCGNTAFPNHITGIKNALGVQTLTVNYNAQGRLEGLADMYGKPTAIGGGMVSGNATSQSVTDSTGTSAEVIQDDHGNPIRTITQVRDDQGKLVGYQVSVQGYSYSAPEGLLYASRSSRQFFIAGEDGIGLRYTVAPATASDWQSVTTYDYINTSTYQVLAFPGNVTSQTDAAGRTTRYSYDYPVDADGNQLPPVLLSVTDPYGNVTSYVPNTDGTVQSTTRDNVAMRYTYTDGTGAYAALPKGLVIDTYRKIGTDAEVLLSHNAYYTSGDNIGMLLSTTDAAGVTTTYTYNAMGQMTQVSRSWTDAQSNPHSVIDSKTFYDAVGRTVETRDVNGIRSGTIYDAVGRVQTTGRLASNAPNNWYTLSNASQYFLPNSLATYTYDGRDNVIQTSYGDGTITRSAYDSQNRVEWSTDRYDPTAGLLPNGTHSIYDSMGRVVRTEQVSKVNIALETDVDIPGNDTIKRSYLVASGTTVSWTQSVYDEQGRVIQTVQSDGRTSETLYDEKGRAFITTDLHVAGQPAKGTRSNYDTLGRVGSSDRLFNVVITISASAGGINSAALTSLVGIAGSSQTHYNDADHGRVDYTLGQTGQRTEYTYDELGRQKTVTQKAVPTGQARSLIDQTTTYDCDPITGRTACITDALGHKTWTYYDAPGNVIKKEFNDHSFVLYGFNDKGQKTSETTQLASGATQAQIDAATTTYSYDTDGNLIAVIMPAVADPNNGGTMTHPRHVYTYDQYGRQTRQIDANASKTLAANLSTVTDAQYEAVPHTHFYYDTAGRRIRRELPSISGNTVSELSFYDGLGRLRAKSDFAGNLSVYTYDDMGRQTAETIFSKAQANTILSKSDWTTSVASVADLAAVLAKADSATPTWGASGFGVQTTTHYDSYSQPDAVVIKEDADRNGTLDTTRTEDTQYDAQGRTTLLTTPEGTVHYAYNDPGQKTDMWTDSATTASATNWTQYDYDSLGRLWHVKAMRLNGADYSSTPLIAAYSYDAAGNLDAMTEDNGTATTSDDLVHDYDYDALNRLDLETVKRGTQTLETYDYFLRSDSLRDHVIETGPTGAVTRIAWAYDAVGRLTSETRDEGNDSVQNGGDYTDSYTLDLVGNQKQKTHDAVGTANDETIIKTYNSRDQLTLEDSGISGKDVGYEYDANGAQALKSSLSDNHLTVTGQTVYKWDLHGRMIAIDANGDGTPETRYGYDSRGVRVTKGTSTGTRQFLNDPQNPTGYAKAVEEKLDANNDGLAESVDKSYVIGQQVIAQKSGSGLYYLIVDGHGSTRAILNAATGTLDQKYDYDVYGKLLNTALTPLTNWLFGGDGIYDPSSGWTYHLARWRDGARFVSYDSFEADPTSPANLHKYVVCNANPMYGWDPTGHNFVETMMAVGIKGLLIAGEAFLGFWAIQRTRETISHWNGFVGFGVSNDGVGGYDITRQLISLRIDALKQWDTMTAARQDAILYYTEANLSKPWSPATCWDIDHLYRSDLRWEISPAGTVWNTVTVNNRVYYQDEVNYYWYGVIGYMKDHRKSLGGGSGDSVAAMLRSINRYRVLLWGGTNIEGRQKWALAGYFGDLSLARGVNIARYTPSVACLK